MNTQIALPLASRQTFNRAPSGGPASPAAPLMDNATTITGARCRIEFDDAGPDGFGRRRFTMLWDQPYGAVALRRGQCFHAVPDAYFTLD